MDWIKAFEEAVQSKDYSILPSLRAENEHFLDQHISSMRRLYAQGDGRALLTAVSNYFQIERQFVKDVMASAERLTPDNQEGIDRVMQQISDFGQKERVFLVEINNALATEGEDAGGLIPEPTDTGANTDEAFEEPRGSIIGESPSRERDEPLPHEKQERRTPFSMASSSIGNQARKYLNIGQDISFGF